VSVFVRGAALACALAPELGEAVARLAKAPPPASPAAEPYFAIPLEGGGWMERAERIARGVASSLRSRAALDAAAWRSLPCFVGCSSLAIGALEGEDDPPLPPPGDFARTLARWFGAEGPVFPASSACTSGLTALQLALDLVAAGAFPHALVLGVELRNRLSLAGFASLGLLSKGRARPCDRARDGLVLGEALGALLISGSGRWRLAAAAARVDASSLTGTTPGGEAIAGAMREALSRSGWTAPDVDLIKLQAAGSPQGDLAEARAVRDVFGAAPQTVSLKGAIGHTLGASGPAELALLLGALETGWVPATWGFAEPDVELGLTPTCFNSASDAAAVRRLLFNLSGFGGSVFTLALERAA
jgi:3-oxoacyl-[acyl-carrier-protein] synthase I